MGSSSSKTLPAQKPIQQLAPIQKPTEQQPSTSKPQRAAQTQPKSPQRTLPDIKKKPIPDLTMALRTEAGPASEKNSYDKEYIRKSGVADKLKTLRQALENCQDISSEAHTDRIKEFHQLTSSGKTKSEEATMAVFLMREGFAKLIPKVWANTEGKEERMGKGYRSLIGILWNMSDTHDDEVAEKINTDALPNIIRYLRGAGKSGITDNVTPPWYEMVTKPYISILENLANHGNSVVKQTMREMNVKELMVGYKQHEKVDLMLRFKAVSVLGALLTESDDNSTLELKQDDINIIVRLLENCSKEITQQPPTDFHRGKVFRYTTHEILGNLNHIAKPVDRNKKLIVDAGALKHYVSLMEPLLDDPKHKAVRETVEQDIYQACHGLWVLAFNRDITKKIMDEPFCMDRLRLHAKSQNERIRKAAEGALWILVERDQAVKKARSRQDAIVKARAHKRISSAMSRQPDPSTTQKPSQKPLPASEVEQMDSLTPDEIGHIMISYNSTVRQDALTLRTQLQQAGFKTWIDQDDMKGSTLEAMSSAIENAELVLILFSEKYKNSPNCRSEAEYTFQLGKPFIPIRVQKGYKADGWLGILLGLAVYFDVNKNNFWEEGIPKLVMSIIEKLREVDIHLTLQDAQMKKLPASAPPEKVEQKAVARDVEDKVFGPASSFPKKQTLPPLKKLDSAVWTEDEVTKWFKENGLGSCANSFKGFKGPHLHELQTMMETGPEAYYNSMRTDLKLRILDLMNLSRALRMLK